MCTVSSAPQHPHTKWHQRRGSLHQEDPAAALLLPHCLLAQSCSASPTHTHTETHGHTAQRLTSPSSPSLALSRASGPPWWGSAERPSLGGRRSLLTELLTLLCSPGHVPPAAHHPPRPAIKRAVNPPTGPRVRKEGGLTHPTRRAPAPRVPQRRSSGEARRRPACTTRPLGDAAPAVSRRGRQAVPKTHVPSV